MVIPSGFGGSQPGQSRVKPWLLLTSKRTGHPQQSPREGWWGVGSRERGGCHIFPLSLGILRLSPVILRGILWADQRWAASIQKSSCLITSQGVCRVCECVVVFESLDQFVPSLTFLYFKGIFHHPDSLLFINPALYKLMHVLSLPSSQTCIFNWMLFHWDRNKKKNQSINQFIQGKKVCVAGCFYISWMPAVSLVSLATISALLTSDEVMMFYGWIIRPRLILLRQRHYYIDTSIIMCHSYVLE